MDAELLPVGRTRLLLPRREDRRIDLSLFDALYRTPPKPEEEAIGRIRSVMGVSAEEALSLDGELSTLRKQLFDLPENMSEEDREGYEQMMPEESRRTGTAWDQMPKIEAEMLPDGRVACLLAHDELSIFGLIDVTLENLASRRDESGRVEVRLCVGVEIEEAEKLRDELLRLDREVRMGGS